MFFFKDRLNGMNDVVNKKSAVDTSFEVADFNAADEDR